MGDVEKSGLFNDIKNSYGCHTSASAIGDLVDKKIAKTVYL